LRSCWVMPFLSSIAWNCVVKVKLVMINGSVGSTVKKDAKMAVKWYNYLKKTFHQWMELDFPQCSDRCRKMCETWFRGWSVVYGDGICLLVAVWWNLSATNPDWKAEGKQYLYEVSSCKHVFG
jgi:hypothetical protein